MTLDTATGMARIVVDGKVLEDAPHPKLKNLADKMLTKFTVVIGNGGGTNAIFTNVNMFWPSCDLPSGSSDPEDSGS